MTTAPEVGADSGGQRWVGELLGVHSVLVCRPNSRE